ncbi:hypothetical protein HDE_10405 [Halotydeus destructor]|nr:hypothetical protein HDE_10405 [Halotydeus destructor]
MANNCSRTKSNNRASLITHGTATSGSVHCPPLDSRVLVVSSSSTTKSQRRRKARIRRRTVRTSSASWSEELWIDGPNAQEQVGDGALQGKHQRIKDWLNHNSSTLNSSTEAASQLELECRMQSTALTYDCLKCPSSKKKSIAVVIGQRADNRHVRRKNSSQSSGSKASSKVKTTVNSSKAITIDACVQTEANFNTDAERSLLRDSSECTNSADVTDTAGADTSVGTADVAEVADTAAHQGRVRVLSPTWTHRTHRTLRSLRQDGDPDDGCVSAPEEESDFRLSHLDDFYNLCNSGQRGTVSECGDQNSSNCSIRGEGDNDDDTQSEPITEPPKQLKLEKFLTQRSLTLGLLFQAKLRPVSSLNLS